LSSAGKKYEFLEHISDVYVAAYGKSLEEAYENIALAMFEAMTDLHLINPILEKTFTVEGEDEESLLYNWLERLLVEFEVENNVFSKFNVEKVGEYDGVFRMSAKAYGEEYDASKHTSKVGIKAVTYHMMEISRRNHDITIKVLFDI